MNSEIADFGRPGRLRTPDRASARIQAVRRLRALDRALAWFPLGSVTFLAKASVPPFGGMGLALGVPAVLALAAFGQLAGRMVVDVPRAVALLLMLSVLLLQQLLVVDRFSALSMALLFAIHAPYAFRLRGRQPDAWQVLLSFQTLVLVIGLCGVIQYGMQFIVGPTLAFPVDNLLPRALLISKYNAQGAVEYGSDVLRATGIFMLEPSLYSQLLAIGIVLELETRRRLWYLGVLTVAILVSFAGTGLMLLAICLAAKVVAERRWDILLGAAAVIAVTVAAALIGDSPGLLRLISRSTEFGAAGSSASMRFVAGFPMFEAFLWPDWLRALFGFGAGSFASYGARAPLPVAEMILFKAVFEFGLVGAGAYFGFLAFCITTATALPYARLPVAIAILLGGMSTPFGHCLAFCLLLWPAPVRGLDRGRTPHVTRARNRHVHGK